LNAFTDTFLVTNFGGMSGSCRVPWVVAVVALKLRDTKGSQLDRGLVHLHLQRWVTLGWWWVQED
jgi:hypothetical protein